MYAHPLQCLSRKRRTSYIIHRLKGLTKLPEKRNTSSRPAPQKNAQKNPQKGDVEDSKIQLYPADG